MCQSSVSTHEAGKEISMQSTSDHVMEMEISTDGPPEIVVRGHFR